MSGRGPDPDAAEPQVIRERIIEREHKSTRKDTIYDALIVAAILALVGAVWNLSQTVTRHDVIIARDDKAIDELVRRTQGVTRGTD